MSTLVTGRPRRASVLRSPGTRWLAGVALVALLVVVAISVVVGRADRQQTDDPRSATPSGAGALGQLLDTEGVRVRTTNRVDDAVAQTARATTLVVAAGDRLSDDEAERLNRTPAARLVLLRPTSAALSRFGVRAEGAAPAAGTFAPSCPADAAQRAGAVHFEDLRASYRAVGPVDPRPDRDFACYPTGAGAAYLRTTTASGRSVDLLAGGISNAALGVDGNAALAMNVIGSQPQVVWLMARTDPGPAADRKPTLLPSWWEMAVVQAFLGLVAVGIWRGRRLGPILSEPLPVTVRASETVEGHGRLYDRLHARDRAAEALRSGARARLSRVFGHAEDPVALSEVVGSRTGRDPGLVRRLLVGPAPVTDDDLVELTRALDRLEQEARQP